MIIRLAMSELKHIAGFLVSGWFLMEGLAAFQSGNSELGGFGVVVWSFYCLWAGGELNKKYGSKGN